MSTLETESADLAAANPGALQETPLAPSPRPIAARRSGASRMLFLAVLFAGSGAAGIYTWKVGIEQVRQDLDHVLAYLGQHKPATGSSFSAQPEKPADSPPDATWDGFVRVTLDKAKTIGLVVVSVQPQVEPIKLPLMGRTDYDPNTLSKIRPRFDTLVERVRVERGEKVKKGDPLVDLFSTELAAAKNDLQTSYVQ